ncbi:MAG: nitronate monooxygenase [Gammaproteobacteria bacterium]|nr:nitronate monooxygenase [Gammaproteobacteria bacterium]
MSTKVSALKHRLRLPAIAAPMFLISGPDLVLAACRAGIIGAFPAPNARTPDILDQWLTQISGALTAADAPWAANLVMHSSYARRQEDLDLVVKHRAPIVITALGSPRDAVEAVHGYGGLVFADVNSVEFAAKAAKTGVDGLVLVAAGAGGHTGQMTGFAFVDAVREFWDGAIILGGGISTGRGVRAAEVLGADFAYLGTRFIATRESLASDEYRQMVVAASAADIVCSPAITGVPANWLRPSLVAGGYDLERLAAAKPVDFGMPQEGAKPWKNVWSAGQGVGVVREVVSVADLVERLAGEYAAACALPPGCSLGAQAGAA